MSNALRLFVAVFLCVRCIPAQSPAPESGAKPIVLQKNDGDFRTRRPREGVASPSSDFLLKIGPKTSGSKHLLLFTEEIRPGAIIPKHKHHAEDEILLIQTGSAHVWLGDKEYDAQPGALIFIPAETWISLKNTGKENISLVAIWNEPGFEEMLLCGSVPKGQVGELLSRDGVKNCYHHGDAELETVQPLANKKNATHSRVSLTDVLQVRSALNVRARVARDCLQILVDCPKIVIGHVLVDRPGHDL